MDGHFFNYLKIKNGLSSLNKMLTSDIHFQNIILQKKKVTYDDNKELLVVYNDVVNLNFELTRDLIKEAINDIQALIDSHIKG